jgi:hypothetical protein
VVPLRAATPDRQGPRPARDHDGRTHAGPAHGRTRRQLYWVGLDDRGIELEIVALDLADAVVIHVTPTTLRKGGQR